MFGVNVIRTRINTGCAKPVSGFKRITAQLLGIPLRPAIQASSVLSAHNEVRKLRAAGIQLSHRYGDDALYSLFSFLTPQTTAWIVDSKLRSLPHQNVFVSIRDEISLDETVFSNIVRTVIQNAKHQKNFKGVIIRKKSGQLYITPEFWKTNVRELSGAPSSQAPAEEKLNALIALGEKLEKSRTFEEIEKSFAEVILLYLGASKVKLYDVDDEFIVTTYEVYERKHGELIISTPGKESDSHFKNGLRPEDYQNENMHPILFDSSSSILVVPTRDRDPRHINGTLPDSAPFKPYVAMRHQIEGKVSRVIIVEVDDPQRIMGEKAITDFVELINRNVADAKEKLLQRETQRIIAALTTELKGRRSVREVLKNAMAYLPMLFKTNGSFGIDKITLMLYNHSDTSLQIREEWIAPGAHRVPAIGTKIFDAGHGDQPISRIILSSGQTIRCTSRAEFEAAKGVRWARGFQGSVLGSPIKTRIIVRPENEREYSREQMHGVLLVSSPKRNAFTKQHEKMIKEICAILGKVLSETSSLEDLLNLDPKFHIAYASGYFLNVLLPALTKESVSTKSPLGGIYFDLDDFGKINKLVGNDIVDKYILKPLMEALDSIKRADDLFISHGGDEFAMLCPSTSAEHTYAAAERLRKYLETKNFTVKVPCHTTDKTQAALKKLKMLEQIDTDPGLSSLKQSIKELQLVQIGEEYFIQFSYNTTMSAGVSAYNFQSAENPDMFLNRLTSATYIAKKGTDGGQKKNRVVRMDP